MAPYPHLPPLMTQLAPQLGQSGVNAARPYYYVGGGSSVVHDLSMQSVQATCSMRLPASTAQQLAAPGVPPLTQLPAASLALGRPVWQRCLRSHFVMVTWVAIP